MCADISRVCTPGGGVFARVFLAFVGLSAGGVIAAGVFAFLAMIGVLPRLIGKTGTKRRIGLYDMMLVAGGLFGNTLDLYGFRVLALRLWFPAVFGAAVGVFVGCLVMSLAETLKALPVISRRIRLSVGLQYVILSVALGKTAGSFLYFWKDMSSG